MAVGDSSRQSIRQSFDLDLDDGQSDTGAVAEGVRSKEPQAPSAGPATAKPAEKSGPAAAGQIEFKTVEDSTGKFKVEAAFDGMVGGKVQLKKRDGSTVLVPLEKLSAADQQWATRQDAAAARDKAADPVEYSLGLLAEARKCLPEIETPAESKSLEKEIGAAEKILNVLAGAKKNDLGPLCAALKDCAGR